jgi:hypothetical protein
MKEGRKEKGLEIVEGFNRARTRVPQSDLTAAFLERERLELAKVEERCRLAQEKVEADAKIAVERFNEEEAGRVKAAAAKAELDRLAHEAAEEKSAQSDDKSAKRMLEDLRFAYRSSVGSGGKKGRQRLVTLMEGDTEFKFFVKELMRVELSQMVARMKVTENPANPVSQNFFVILKGLEGGQGPQTMVGVDADGKTVDVTQISRALDPGNTDRVEETRDSQAAPDLLLGRTAEASE